MELIGAVIVTLVILGSVDRYLHPADYAVAATGGRPRRQRATRLRPGHRPSAPAWTHAGPAARRHSASQVSPFVPFGASRSFEVHSR